MNALKGNRTPIVLVLISMLLALALFPQFSDAATTLIFGDDSRRDPICYSESMAKRAMAVADIDGGCTAFLISPENHILTAAHCFKEDDGFWNESEEITLRFGLQASSCGGDAIIWGPEVKLTQNNVVKDANGDFVMNRDLDYLLLRIPFESRPFDDIAVSGWPVRWLELDPHTRLTQLDESQKGTYILAYNPEFGKLMLSQDNECKVTDEKTACDGLKNLGLTPPDDACFNTRCDSMEGNSGGPIFLNMNNRVVGMPECLDYDWLGAAMEGMKIKRIYPEIRDYLPNEYDLADSDGDGMPNCRDNCPETANTGTCTSGKVGAFNCLGDRDCDTHFGAFDGKCEEGQVDSNRNGIGDVCETLDLDTLEPNDAPNQASELTTGYYELTIHDRDDTDFYIFTVPYNTDYVMLSAGFLSVSDANFRDMAHDLRYKDCDTCPWVLVGMTPDQGGIELRYTENGNIPAGRKYLLELYETERKGPFPYNLLAVIGREKLPPDDREPNDTASAASVFSGCDYIGKTNIHDTSDIDYYKIEALGHSVKVEISYDTSLGDLQLSLCDNNLNCTQAVDSSISGTTRTLSITACGTSPSYVQVQGQPNFYDICVQKVPLASGCPAYVPWTTFAGSGAFDYRIASQWVPGQVDYFHGDVRDNLFVQLTDETVSNYIWTVNGWIDYPSGKGQLFRGTLTIPKGTASGSTVPFKVQMPQLLSAGLREWYQIEGECTAGNVDIFNCNTNSQCDSSVDAGDGICTPVQTGSAQFQGSGNAITSFSATTVEDALFWHIYKASDRGTLVVQGGLDSDGDGILDDVEVVTGTDPYSDDTDGDGLADGTEDANHNGEVDYMPDETDPRSWDTDGDGVSDGVEVGLTSPEGNDTDPDTFQADQDPSTTTDPTRIDTDRDGMSDGEEDANQNGRVDPGETSPLVKDEIISDPDLIIESLTHSPASPTTVDTITFTAVVKNIGNAPAGPSILNLKVGGETFGQDFAIPELSPEEAFMVQRQEILSVAQNYRNTATADINNDVTESREDNNQITDDYTVGLHGDLDGDADIDRDDYSIFSSAYGSCDGDANFIPGADLDRDGCVTINDYRIFRTLLF